jgi:serine/threonine protein kinase
MIDNKFNIKVTDFGLAKCISGGNTNRMGQSFVGTVAYSAPEIVQRQDYNEKADIWSFGCILRELMCLRAAFVGGNPLILAKVIVNREFNS